MASGNQLKALIKSYKEGDDSRFYATAMQIAASEAKKGNKNLATQLRDLIDEAKKNTNIESSRYAVPIARPQGELSELLEVFYPDTRIDDMVLHEETKNSLSKIINEQKEKRKLIKYGLQPSRKLLLVGPPGCGKTMSAQAIAGELKIPIFVVRLDGLITKFMGESIAKLRLIFDAMKENRGVYLFDEFDSIGTTRGFSNDVGEIKRVLNSFLLNIENDTSESIIIAATNFREVLDRALFRRFDDIVNFKMPEKKQILETTKRHLKNVSLDKGFNFDEVANQSIGLSYADIVRSCNDAIKSMLMDNSKSLDHQVLLRILSDRIQY
ncbi:ATP-binding protein [Rhodohalobacter sp. SW132]|uniref:AAA family ATPase n=1 Tax=Rhodohalobacter sp. SW132 TaxID=2293433 RepID=UPI000E23C3FB|nr:ATP-binding protein [Rhodohalobacter sp. SW132]REL24692.1 ATP-binding protein [Rhodohalobacter sp. SW132]